MPEPTDPRSATRARIVEVAARLLAEQGPASVTTRAVADGAGVQAPTIYRLFGDKDGLLEAVAEHVMAAHVEAKTRIEGAAVAAGSDALDDLRTSWMAQIEFGLANPAVFRMLSEPERVRRSPAARSGQQVLEGRIQRVAATGRLRVSEQRAVALVQAAGIGTIQVLLATEPEHRDPGLAASMYDAVLAQVLTTASTTTGDETPTGDAAMTAAVTFRAHAPRLEVLSDAERGLLEEWLDRVIGSGSPSTPTSSSLQSSNVHPSARASA